MKIRPAAFLLLAIICCSAGADEILVEPAREAVPLPGGEGGLHLDDFYFDRALGLLVVPAGRTGLLDFVDPKTRQVSSMAGFAAPSPSARTADGPPAASTMPVSGGITSADGGGGLVFVTDRTDRKLYLVDGVKRKILGAVPLSSGPDYVRYVGPTREVWVTEPRESRIEVFSLAASTSSSEPARSDGFIKADSGEFEALAVDTARGLAYSNQGGATVAIDLKSRKVVDSWPNPCKRAEGLALDKSRGFLVVACREGLAAVLDVGRGGRELSSLAFGDGIDIISFSPELSRLYLPGAKSATMAFAGLSDEGKLSLLGQVETAPGARCVAADDAGGAWVCDNRAGGLLYIWDRRAAGMRSRY